MSRSHLVAILQALLVTVLWSSSWVLIKQGLEEIPALTFAGLRYLLAAVLLWALLLSNRRRRAALAALEPTDWRRLLGLGVVAYSLTQGAQFLALTYLPAQTTSLVLSFTPVVVAVMAALLLAERMNGRQWLGIGLVILGALGYFLPMLGQGGVSALGHPVGLAIIGLGVLANAGAAVMGRGINRGGRLDPLLVTSVSMGIGAVLLLAAGWLWQGMPDMGWRSWAIVAWLAVVNTAFAFTLWNLTMRSLSAVESSVINNTMLVQIAVLAWLFLGEPLGLRQLLAFGCVLAGTVVVQLRRPGGGGRGGPKQGAEGEALHSGVARRVADA